MKTASLAVIVALVSAEPILAQADPSLRGRPRPLMVRAVRDLTFGTLYPGISASISPDDPRHYGLFEVQGERGVSVRIELVLPQSMFLGNGVDELLLAFGPGDGMHATNRGRGRGVLFDPGRPLMAVLGQSGKLYVRLGGTALPSPVQSGGTYRATISLTVYNLGS